MRREISVSRKRAKTCVYNLWVITWYFDCCVWQVEFVCRCVPFRNSKIKMNSLNYMWYDEDNDNNDTTTNNNNTNTTTTFTITDSSHTS